MTRLKMELINRGIIYDEDELQVMMRGPEYDQCRKLVAVTNDFIITVYHSAVLPSEIHLFDRRTLTPIGGQNLFPESFFHEREWNSFVWEVEG